MTKVSFPEEMLLFGCGNMAGAMVQGWLRAGVASSSFVAVKPTMAGLPKGTSHYTSAKDAGRQFDWLMLGVKPQKLDEVAGDVRSLLSEDATVISILAGVELAHLQSLFPGRRIIRVMPNLAVALGQSPLGFWGGDISNEAQAEIDAIFAPLGTSVWLENEEQMDAFTALAGSGPAFVYRFIDALAAGGTATGLDAKDAESIAIEMMSGAIALAAASSHSPGELAQQVAAPGGMTAEGLDILDEDATLASLIKKTLRATCDRGAELARLAKGDGVI